MAAYFWRFFLAGIFSVRINIGIEALVGRMIGTVSEVRSKILVRLRNLVIFQVFGVKLSAKKSIFKVAL